ncbi:hypothetical protein JB92DRAFT_3169848 [Gautieria morchelliformis]|nr:hypothetical protein JB92DRAFT_3169848 [Gautieria morchelliformis]
MPPVIQDFIQQICGGKVRSGPLLTHCCREFIQAVWALLLDDDFVEAYKHGIVVMCDDGIQRRIYLRLMTYSAYYLEKMLMLSLRDKGTKWDMVSIARPTHRSESLCTRRHMPSLTASRHVLGWQNTLYSRITAPSFNKYQVFPVDIMHEVELGVWKAGFMHLIRLLNALSPDQVHKLNKRFHAVPTFGHDTIGCFSNNVSEMKKLAARDFEHILQVNSAVHYAPEATKPCMTQSLVSTVHFSHIRRPVPRTPCHGTTRPRTHPTAVGRDALT